MPQMNRISDGRTSECKTRVPPRMVVKRKRRANEYEKEHSPSYVETSTMRTESRICVEERGSRVTPYTNSGKRESFANSGKNTNVFGSLQIERERHSHDPRRSSNWSREREHKYEFSVNDRHSHGRMQVRRRQTRRQSLPATRHSSSTTIYQRRNDSGQRQYINGRRSVIYSNDRRDRPIRSNDRDDSRSNAFRSYDDANSRNSSYIQGDKSKNRCLGQQTKRRNVQTYSNSYHKPHPSSDCSRQYNYYRSSEGATGYQNGYKKHRSDRFQHHQRLHRPHSRSPSTSYYPREQHDRHADSHFARGRKHVSAAAAYHHPQQQQQQSLPEPRMLPFTRHDENDDPWEIPEYILNASSHQRRYDRHGNHNDEKKQMETMKKEDRDNANGDDITRHYSDINPSCPFTNIESGRNAKANLRTSTTTLSSSLIPVTLNNNSNNNNNNNNEVTTETGGMTTATTSPPIEHKEEQSINSTTSIQSPSKQLKEAIPQKKKKEEEEEEETKKKKKKEKRKRLQIPRKNTPEIRRYPTPASSPTKAKSIEQAPRLILSIKKKDGGWIDSCRRRKTYHNRTKAKVIISRHKSDCPSFKNSSSGRCSNNIPPLSSPGSSRSKRKMVIKEGEEEEGNEENRKKERRKWECECGKVYSIRSNRSIANHKKKCQHYRASSSPSSKHIFAKSTDEKEEEEEEEEEEDGKGEVDRQKSWTIATRKIRECWCYHHEQQLIHHQKRSRSEDRNDFGNVDSDREDDDNDDNQDIIKYDGPMNWLKVSNSSHKRSTLYLNIKMGAVAGGGGAGTVARPRRRAAALGSKINFFLGEYDTKEEALMAGSLFLKRYYQQPQKKKKKNTTTKKMKRKGKKKNRIQKQQQPGRAEEMKEEKERQVDIPPATPAEDAEEPLPYGDLETLYQYMERAALCDGGVDNWFKTRREGREGWKAKARCHICGEDLREWIYKASGASSNYIASVFQAYSRPAESSSSSSASSPSSSSLSYPEKLAKTLWGLHCTREKHRENQRHLDRLSQRKQMHCYCKRPEIGGEVQCSRCQRWVHPECDLQLRYLDKSEISRSDYKYVCIACDSKGENRKKDMAKMRRQTNMLPYLGMLLPKIRFGLCDSTQHDDTLVKAKATDGSRPLQDLVSLQPPHYNFKNKEHRDKYSSQVITKLFRDINNRIATMTEKQLRTDENKWNGECREKLESDLAQDVEDAVKTAENLIEDHIRNKRFWQSYTRKGLIKLGSDANAFVEMNEFARVCGLTPEEPEKALECLLRHPHVDVGGIKSGGRVSKAVKGISIIHVGSPVRGLRETETVINRNMLAAQLLSLRYHNSSAICMTLYIKHCKAKKRYYGLNKQILLMKSRGLRTCGMNAAHVLLKVSGKESLEPSVKTAVRERIRTALHYQLTPKTQRSLNEVMERYGAKQYHHTLWHQDSLSFYNESTEDGTIMTTLYYQLVGESFWNTTSDMRLGAAMNLLQVCYQLCPCSKERGNRLIKKIRDLLAKAYLQCDIEHICLRQGETLYVPAWSTHEVISPDVSIAYAQELWSEYPEGDKKGKGCVKWDSMSSSPSPP